MSVIEVELKMRVEGENDDYFSSAVQIGLTATPKRKFNADTYDYFGEPDTTIKRWN